MKGEKKMEENVMIVPDEEIGVDELEENLTGEVEQQQAEESDELVAALRQGLSQTAMVRLTNLSYLRTAGRRANWTR